MAELKKLAPFDIRSFKDWLTQRGAIIEPATSVWEVLRVDTIDGKFIVYKNKKGVETWPDGLMDIVNAFREGRSIPLSPDQKKRKRLKHLVEEIAQRDGLYCWFCEVGFLSTDSREITIEHLVSLCHGGPNHLSNIVISCQPCNEKAGSISVSEKVKFRDGRRS